MNYSMLLKDGLSEIKLMPVQTLYLPPVRKSSINDESVNMFLTQKDERNQQSISSIEKKLIRRNTKSKFDVKFSNSKDFSVQEFTLKDQRNQTQFNPINKSISDHRHIYKPSMAS